VRRLKVKKDQKEDEKSSSSRKSVRRGAQPHAPGDQLLERARWPPPTNTSAPCRQAPLPYYSQQARPGFAAAQPLRGALAALKKALDVDPDSAGTYVQLGRLHYAAKNYAESRSMLEEAIQINPFNPQIYRLLTEVYAALGEANKAKQAKANLGRLMGKN
jgi:predicted Zn-dependent protease